MIPNLYRKSLLNFIKKFPEKENYYFYEFFKEKTTYHSKGFYFYYKNLENSKIKEYITIYGSSNFSKRSYSKDLETQFYFFSKNLNFVNKIENEKYEVFKNCEKIDKKKILEDKDVKVGSKINFFYYFFNKFL